MEKFDMEKFINALYLKAYQAGYEQGKKDKEKELLADAKTIEEEE